MSAKSWLGGGAAARLQTVSLACADCARPTTKKHTAGRPRTAMRGIEPFEGANADATLGWCDLHHRYAVGHPALIIWHFAIRRFLPASTASFAGILARAWTRAEQRIGDAWGLAQSELERVRPQTNLDERITESVHPEHEFRDGPSVTEIRAALERVLASDMFRVSPQLVAFLRFVVEATLGGEGERIKGYTIAVEALGRGEDFDPQADPIVRVEAGRLRRALAEYYAGPGATDLVIIDIPRGRYIPTFRYRSAGQVISVSFTSEDGSLATPTLLAWRGSFASIGGVRHILLFVPVLALIGIAVLLAIDWSDHPTERATRTPVATDQQLLSAFRAGNGMPVIFVQPIDMLGAPGAPTITPHALRSKLRDALSRFDEFNVTSDVVANATKDMTMVERPPAGSYQLGGIIEDHGGARTTLRFWLVDVSDGAVVWSRTFDVAPAGTAAGAAEDPILREVVVILAGPFGFIHARERGKSDIDPRYACLLKAYHYLHGFDASLHAGVRTCLERMTRLDPTFADGFSALSMVYHREYATGTGVVSGDSPPLDRALKAAQRAASLKPQSARAHEALLLIYFDSGTFAEAFAEGEVALTLNPLDRSVPAVYGMILVATGRLDRGEALLREASAGTNLKPTWVSFYLFLVSYLKGDLTSASSYASLDVSDTYPLGMMARVLVAAQTGDRERAQRLAEHLVALYPGFREDPRRALDKFIRSPEILDRLTQDLAAAGLGQCKTDDARGRVHPCSSTAKPK
jgi:tetratricopeptide (TPR) repeat protein/TolB-like protein